MFPHEKCPGGGSAAKKLALQNRHDLDFLCFPMRSVRVLISSFHIGAGKIRHTTQYTMLAHVTCFWWHCRVCLLFCCNTRAPPVNRLMSPLSVEMYCTGIFAHRVSQNRISAPCICTVYDCMYGDFPAVYTHKCMVLANPYLSYSALCIISA